MLASKDKIIEMIKIGVFSFDLDLESCLSTDYSKDGMDLTEEDLQVREDLANMLS